MPNRRAPQDHDGGREIAAKGPRGIKEAHLGVVVVRVAPITHSRITHLEVDNWWKY
mgnify:CR=1 FL=1